MRFYDLFSGIGGFRLGCERAGHTCVGGAEIDKYAREVYKHNFGDYPTHSDIRNVATRDIPEHDILCAGFPCQAFSVAGKRMGFDDTRGTLFFEICRIAKQKRPRYLLLENVRGLLYHNEGETFRAMLSTLDELGYDAEWQVLNCKDFGIPQHRERVFIVGHARGEDTEQVFPLGTHEADDNRALGSSQSEGERLQSPHTRTIDATYYKGGWHGTLIAYASHINPDRWGDHIKEVDVMPTLNTAGDLCVVKDFVMLGHTKANMKQRIQSRDASWTLDTSGGSFGIIEDAKIRRLTPLECERLMGFPDGWTDADISDTQRYKMLGNSVVPAIIEAIASW